MQRSRILIFTWILGLVTGIIMLASFPDFSTVDITVWLLFAVLVGVMLNLSTLLDEVVVSPATTAAMMAYLTIGEGQAAPAAVWCVAVGALGGNLGWLARTLPGQPWPAYGQVLRNVTISIVQLTIGVFIAGWAYQQFDGRLPLDQLHSADILPLSAFFSIYLAIYLSILLLEAHLSRRRTPRMVAQYWQGLVGVILLPLPFAVVGAVAYHELSSLAFAILIGGLLIIVTGVHRITQAEARSREQVLELSALSAISQAMRSNLDFNALLDVVYEQVSNLINVDNFTVALFDENRSVLYYPLNIQQHQHVPREPHEAGNGLLEWVITQRAPLLLPDRVTRRAQEMGRTPPDRSVYSWLGVPLVAPERVLGCMAVYSDRSGQSLTPKDLHVLANIAGQTGIATDNTQLYDQARDRAVQLATLNNISVILSGTLDVEQILDLTGSSAVAVASCNAIALYMWWDGTHHPLTLARHNGLSEHFVDNAPAPLLMDIDDLQRRRQPVIVTDMSIDQRTHNIRPLMNREQKHAWIEFLLRKGDDLLGILVFYYHESRRFSTDEIELLRTFTNQAALAISNARLYTQTDEALDRRVEQLSALAEISRELTSTLNMQGLFQLVLDRALEATQSATGLLLLRTEDSNQIPSLVAYRGFPPDAFDRTNPLGGYVAKTFSAGEPTLIADLVQESGIVRQDERVRSQLNVPVMRNTEVLGVISLGSDRPDDYTPDDQTFVTQLANQARIAIDNARLFRRIEIARDRLQIILDSMKEAVILIEAGGSITLANPRVEWLLGLSPQAVLDVPVVDLLNDPDLELAERLGFQPDALLALVHNLDNRRWETTSRGDGRLTFAIQTPQKTRFVDRTNAPVRDETGRVIGLLMVFSDVTEERELEQAREDLSNMIVHDLRGPLTAITTSLKLLNEIAPPDDPIGRAVKQTTEAAARAVRKLLNLVDSLLDISKLESGMMTLEREPAQLAPLCRAVADEFAPLAQELEVSLGVDIPDDLAILNIDSEKIERVLLNLVDNAIKFTPAGGSVSIRAYMPKQAGGSDEYVRVDVRDSGPGVPDEHKERLFDRFAQLDEQRGRRRGTGLGLTFCKLAVEAHEGEIWVEDNPGGGAVFAFTLPVLDEASWV